MNGWDIALILTVAVMGTLVAYLHNPEHKATVLMLPVPFTIAVLAVGQPIAASNVLAGVVMFGYTLAAWAMYARLKLPILLAIAIAVAGYCLVGMGITKLNLSGDREFWVSLAVVFLAGVALIRGLPYREEPHHRTPLPVWIKFPSIALVVVGLVLIKKQLGGFTTFFPMVGIVATYESRFSLWTNVRRIPWILVIMMPMLASIRLWQTHVSMGAALLLSWPVYLAGMCVFHALSRKAYDEEAD